SFRRDMKKRWSIVLVLLQLTAAICLQAQLGSGDVYDFTVNEYNTNTITITGYYGGGGAVVLPTNVNGWTVTGIGYAAFNGCTNFTSVTIAGTITNIGDFSFANCTSLTNA